MKLAVSGKGGVGKTTLATLFAQVCAVRTQEVCSERLLASLDCLLSGDGKITKP